MTQEKINGIIKEHHIAMVEKGFYDCPNCEGCGEVEIMDVKCYDGEPTEIFEKEDCDHCDGSAIDLNKNIGELLMLIISELSEALEAHRCGRFADKNQLNRFLIELKHPNAMIAFEATIKDTFEDELADVLLRIFDLCGYLGVEPKVKDYSSREFSKNIGEEFIKFTSFLVVIDQIYRMPPIDPDDVVKVKIGWLVSDLIKFCQQQNIDIEKHILAKMEYNKTRPHKHGKEY